MEKGVGAKNPAIQAMLGGQDPRHDLSSGAAAMPVNSDGVSVDMSHAYATGNLAADMYCNIAADAPGGCSRPAARADRRPPATKDMLSFLIARDTLHQQQWMAVLEELGGPSALPIPNSFPREQENTEFSYTFFSTGGDGEAPPEGRWSSGRSYDGQGEFPSEPARPLGEEPVLSSPPAESYAQTGRINGGPGSSPQSGNPDRPERMGGGMMNKVKDALS